MCENNSSFFQFLIKNGAEVNSGNDNGITPIYRAALNGHLNVVKVSKSCSQISKQFSQLLIKYDAETETRDRYGLPLIAAFGKGHLDIAKVF